MAEVLNFGLPSSRDSPTILTRSPIRGNLGFMLRTRLTLAPGQNGTKKLTRKYGERLICVRYRYDEEARQRFKTVELVVDDVPWEYNRRPDPLVRIRLSASEVALRSRVKEAGGRWLPYEKLWELPRSAARRLRLQSRIVSQRSGSADEDRYR